MTHPTALRPASLLVHGGVNRSQFDETAEALFLTSGFVYADAEQAEGTFAGTVQHFQYSRFGNPTVAMLEERLAAIEGAEACRATATGMAAVNAALLAHLKAGDRVVASRALFGSCHWIVSTLLPKFGIATEFVDGTDLAQWRAALARPAQIVLLETPSNPMLDIVDLPAVAQLAHAAGAMVVVDNVFATPLLQKPLELGADVVVYSCTKHIDGQGRVLGGAVLGRKKWVEEVLQPFIRNTGPSLSAFNAWLLLKGLETLPLRVDAACRGAERVAGFLATRREVARVWYPTRQDHPQHRLAMSQMSAGGTVVTCEIAGGKAAAFRVMNALKLIRISNNLGDSKSLATHPATTTHLRIGEAERSRLGITDGVVRFSIGLEDPIDLEADLAQALATLGQSARAAE
jgi:O-succinylhomoserine sulfhydrylase